MPSKSLVPITPSVLRWAIDSSGFGVEYIATKLKVSVDDVRRWLEGTAKPSVTNFRRLANVLKRPPAVLLLPSPPEYSATALSFRRPVDEERDSLNPTEIKFVREAQHLQEILSWARDEMGGKERTLPSVSTRTDPNFVANEVRAALQVSFEDQRKWKSPSQAFRTWRTSLENLGIYVFAFSLGTDSCRGFSLWDDFAPVIAVNTSWAVTARIFTLFHELGHLITRTSSLCIDPARHMYAGDGDEVERWCERFAAATILPADRVLAVVTEDPRYKEHGSIDLESLGRISRIFKTSLTATAIRLVQLDLADWDVLNEIPTGSDKKKKSGGGSPRSSREIRQDMYGLGAVSTLVEANERDYFSRHEVLRLLKVSDNDLYDIQSDMA
jgi:Zn-dependent peptidase ImmA (M78 family)